MAWKETSPVMEKMKFLAAWRSGLDSMTELCRRFGVSRKTGYKLVARWREEEAGAIHERSRAPKSCPWAVSDEVREEIVELRRCHPSWGPKKLRAWLERHRPQQRWPALSTFGEILRQAGMTTPQRRRKRAAPLRADVPAAPNELWCVDYKGHFLTRNRTRCDPLTVTDEFSRYLLCCAALSPPISTEDVKTIFRAVFRKRGLPLAIKSDNGSPFAHAAGIGLTRLSAWWIRIGISPRRIEPGHPQQNGRHERMHRTLKAETISPPAASLAGQQARFDLFRATLNDERSHEALGLVITASDNTSSPRLFLELIPAPDYDDGTVVRRVARNGCLKWRKESYYLSSALWCEWVRVVPHDEEPVLSIIYYRELVGRLDLKRRIALGPDPGALPRTLEFSAFQPKHENEEGEEGEQ